MDPTGDIGLATPSLEHGCSTVDDEGGWIKVENNKRRLIKQEDEELDVASPDDQVKTTSDMGYPPKHNMTNSFEVLSDFETNDADEEHEEQDKKPAAVEQAEKPKKKLKTSSTKLKEDEHADFMDACDKARMQYIEDQVKEQVCHTYFKFENGTIMKIDKALKLNDENPNRIYLPTSTLDHIDYTQDIGGIYYEHNMLPAIIPSDPAFIDFDINGDLIHNQAFNSHEMKQRDFQEYIPEARALPKIYGEVYPAMRKFRHDACVVGGGYNIHNGSSVETNDQTIWNSNGRQKKSEFRKEMSTFLMYEIERNNLMDSFTEHYQRTEETLDTWRVPHNERWRYRRMEYYYVSLIMHDMLPNQYMDQLLPKDTPPRGTLFNYFNKKDDVNTAKKKWYAAIKNDYEQFWQTLLSPQVPEDMSIDT